MDVVDGAMPPPSASLLAAGAGADAAAAHAAHAGGYSKPVRRLTDEAQMPLWHKSEGRAKVLSFIQTISKAIEGCATTDPCHQSETVTRFLDVLDTLENLANETPLEPQEEGRYGNKAFRTWHKKMTDASDGLLAQAVGPEHADLVVELAPYFRDSFGNATRIDYGSGHELAFVALMTCCALARVFEEADSKALALRLFNRYLGLVRLLQQKYRLEPAGSHGVWGLDDYQFLCYYWGASQLIGQDIIKPEQIPDATVAHTNGPDFMFFDALRFIFKMKSGPFYEHSRYLYNISAVPTWHKVNKGLLKMYKEEVLAKFPIVQHFLFGSLLPFKAVSGGSADTSAATDIATSTAPVPESTWGCPVPTRDSPQTGIPLAGPLPGGQDVIASMPVIMARSGNARVAERGSLRPRPKPESS